jgi:copper chaperone
MTEKTLKVNGMSCNHCKMRVEKAVAEVPGVREASVDLDAGTLHVSMEDGEETLTKIKDAVAESGYEVV